MIIIKLSSSFSGLLLFGLSNEIGYLIIIQDKAKGRVLRIVIVFFFVHWATFQELFGIKTLRGSVNVS